MKRAAIWTKQTMSESALWTGFRATTTTSAESTAMPAKRRKNAVSIVPP